jgi:hypothetical protein
MAVEVSEHLASFIFMSVLAALVLLVAIRKRRADRQAMANAGHQRQRRSLVCEPDTANQRRTDEIDQYRETCIAPGGQVPMPRVPENIGSPDIRLTVTDGEEEEKSEEVVQAPMQRRSTSPGATVMEAFERDLEAAFESYAAESGTVTAIEEVLDRYGPCTQEDVRGMVSAGATGQDSPAGLAEAIEWVRMWVADRKRCPGSEGR